MTDPASDCATHNGPTMELKLCPFCGGEPIIEEHPAHTHKLATFMPDHPGSWTIECACGCGLIRDMRETVVDAWNARSPDPFTILRTTLQCVRDTIENDPQDLNSQSISDTIWISPIETMVDYIDAALSTRQPEPMP